MYIVFPFKMSIFAVLNTCAVHHVYILPVFLLPDQQYLSSLGVLHRDLACRNILVDESKVLKIADFGLARNTKEYVSSMKDKLPLRWMSPETFNTGTFSEKSDV